MRIYSPEKTIADCFKYRNKIGLDTAIGAFKLYHEKRQFNPEDLLKIARVCRVEKLFRPYLEALLWQDVHPRILPLPYVSLCQSRPGKRSGLLVNCFNTSQWRGFIRKNRLKNVPQELMEVITAIAAFLKSITEQLATGTAFKETWKAPGPWRKWMVKGPF